MIGPHHMGGWTGFAWWWGLLWLLLWLIFLAGAIALAVLFIRSRDGSRGVDRRESSPTAARASGDRALEILRERFARGEITEEQFDAMRERLQQRE